MEGEIGRTVGEGEVRDTMGPEYVGPCMVSSCVHVSTQINT